MKQKASLMAMTYYKAFDMKGSSELKKKRRTTNQNSTE